MKFSNVWMKSDQSNYQTKKKVFRECTYKCTNIRCNWLWFEYQENWAKMYRMNCQFGQSIYFSFEWFECIRICNVLCMSHFQLVIRYSTFGCFFTVYSLFSIGERNEEKIMQYTDQVMDSKPMASNTVQMSRLSLDIIKTNYAVARSCQCVCVCVRHIVEGATP